MTTRLALILLIGLLSQLITTLSADEQKSQGKADAAASLEEQARTLVQAHIQSVIAQNGNYTFENLESPVPRILKFLNLHDKVNHFKGKTNLYEVYVAHADFQDLQSKDNLEIDFSVLYMDVTQDGKWQLWGDWSAESAHPPIIHKVNGVERCSYNEFGECIKASKSK